MDSKKLAEPNKSFWKELYEKPRKEFEKKSSSEKFMELFEDLMELEEKVDILEGKIPVCCCDETKDWIEKIKFEQHLFLERIESLEFQLENLEEKLKKVLKNKWPAQS